jgi:pilus assembly protein CpaB
MRRGGVLILLLGVLLIVGAVAAFLFLNQGSVAVGPDGAQGGPTALPTEDLGVDVVAAAVDIQQNTVLADGATLLELENIPTAQYEQNQDQYFTSIAEVEGQLLTRNYRVGELIERADLTEPGLAQQLPTQQPDRPRDKAYPFVVNNLSGVADQINPGDFVDVVATFTVSRRQSYPNAQRLEEQAGQVVTVTERELLDLELNTTKTIVQRAQVLRILRPQVAADGTPEAEAAPVEGGPPQVDASGQPITEGTEGVETSPLTAGIWTVILAVNNQEAELIEFALSTDSRVVLVLRGAGDDTFEPTIGASFDLLISEFGVPNPAPLPPRVFSEEEVFIGDPTVTPAPTRVP